jgi:hypothetical protein
MTYQHRNLLGVFCFLVCNLDGYVLPARSVYLHHLSSIYARQVSHSIQTFSLENHLNKGRGREIFNILLVQVITEPFSGAKLKVPPHVIVGMDSIIIFLIKKKYLLPKQLAAVTSQFRLTSVAPQICLGSLNKTKACQGHV